ncbi:MAG: FMN-binding negative transcriptional regulator [Alphaproteobacteria bacterium]|nr:FMN-binding negative transcriptional regulator [Alphaproteobacteria bacterium]MBU2085129.1 FMN-binding negative transcriptional regulator [Alphaproteobacteria bacterium]MBU2142059.1 FMN-binding negative transcriptional regulator [Alphaproteobacteria bacterium]MBU2196951.1 FMN-binding negative transcriptional regulator [Alphaproteobacteria bacterium]
MTSAYEEVSSERIGSFIADNPLAWIVPVADPSSALLMPLLLEVDSDGTPASFLGHLPRSAAATNKLMEQPGAIALFLGPHAYIQPSWISKPGWAPTWNFVSLKATGDITIDKALSAEAVTRLVEHMENPTASGWTVDEIGPRFEGLLKGIIGFRMRIDELAPRFKVGQDESPESLQEIKSALADETIAKWMD